MNKEPNGQVIVLVFYFPTMRFHKYPKPFCWTPTGRMNFMYGQGLFQGMKQESLGQFRLMVQQDRAEMVTTPADYGKHSSKFAREVMKAVLKGRHIKTVKTRA